MKRLWMLGAALGCLATGCKSAAPVREAARPDSTATDTTGTIYSANALPIPDLGYNAREGRTVYRRYCLNCHGEEGKGDGFNAYNLDPRPASLTDSTFQVTHTDADLLTAIRSGGPAAGLSNMMPPWGHTLSTRQMQNVLEYVRVLAASDTAQSGATGGR